MTEHYFLVHYLHTQQNRCIKKVKVTYNLERIGYFVHDRALLYTSSHQRNCSHMHTLPLNLIALTIYIPLLFTAAWVMNLAYHGNWDHLYWTAACTCQWMQSVLSVAANPSDSPLHIAVCHFSICTFTYQPLNLSAFFFLLSFCCYNL